MRRETSVLPGDGENDPAAVQEPTVHAAAVAAAVATAEPTPMPTRGKPGRLTVLMTQEEPARTEALEKAANSSLTVNLRSRTDEEVRWRYGEHILVVPPTPKPFAAPHAIHLLFCAADLVEEVEDTP